MKKGVRFRIYPNKEQIVLLNKTFGCCRLVYNKGLDLRQTSFSNGISIGFNETSAMLTELKKKEEYSFLKDVDSVALQQSLRDLDRSFKNFFQKRAGFPKFKSKHNNKQSYRTISKIVRLEDNFIRLPKLGHVKVKRSMDVGNITNVTIEKTPTNKYFVVLNTEFDPVKLPVSDKEIGIDVGIRTLYTDSNGNKIDSPHNLKKSLKKLAREQRKLSRKEKGSNNRRKQRLNVARVHEKVTEQRKDFLHKVSTTLIEENQTVCVEDINVQDFVIKNGPGKRRKNINRALADTSLYSFLSMLEYKGKWYGRKIVKVSSSFPSSEKCSSCGNINPLVKDLSIRRWNCPKCGKEHDRDINAAINILNKEVNLI